MPASTRARSPRRVMEAKRSRVQGVEADVQAIDAGLAQRAGQLGQQVAVGGQRDVLDAGDRAQHAHQLRPDRAARSARRRSAAPARTPRPTKQATSAAISSKREDVGAVDVVDAVLGHAVGAAVVAAVGDRHAQVVHHPVLAVDQERRLRRRVAHAWVMRSVARALQLGDDVAQLGEDQPFQRQPHGGGRAGHQEHAPVDRWCRRSRATASPPAPSPANDSMRNSSPNPSRVLSKRARQRLDGGVAAGDASAAGQQDGVAPAALAAIHESGPRPATSAGSSRRIARDTMVRPARRAQLADQPAALVGRFGAGVRDGDDGDPDRRPRRCSMFVLARGHGRHYYTVRQTVPGWRGRAARTRPARLRKRNAYLGNKASDAIERSLTVFCRPAALVCNDVLCPFAHNAVLVEPAIGKIIKEFGGTTGK